MIKQLELSIESMGREPDTGLADKMIAYLERVKGWRTRDDLSRELGYTARECRIGRQFANGAIIFGQQGFRATLWSTRSERDICRATLRSQAAVMMREADNLPL